jgi:Fic family protein
MVCLPTSDPLLCERSEKANLETRNTLKQLLYVEDLVRQGVKEVRESHVLGFHQLAVEGIFPCGGQYRTLTRTAELQGGSVRHVPPEPAMVQTQVQEALVVVNGLLLDGQKGDSRLVLRAAAYALWRFNWIHPFAGGNGRTSRALAYLVLCIDYGRGIPGRPSMPKLIARRRQSYEQALRAADVAHADGREDLDAMTRLVTETIIEQLQHAERVAETRRRSPSVLDRARSKAARRSSRDARRRNRG